MMGKGLLRALYVLVAVLGLTACVVEEADELASVEQEVALPPPTNLTATVVSSKRVELAWDPSPGAVMYLVMRGPAPNTEISITTTLITTWIDDTRLPNTQYCYVVKNFNAQLERSAASNEVCVTTPPAATPTPVTNLTATPISSSRINLAWDPSPGALSYFVDMRQGTSGPFAQQGSVVAPQTTLQVANLLAGTTYSFQVRARTADGIAAPSNIAVATTFLLGLEGYWRFDNASGSSATDSSGLNRHATLNNATWSLTDRAPIDRRGNPSALAIGSDSSSSATVPLVQAFRFTQNFSLSAWVHLPAAASTVHIMGMRAPSCGPIGWGLIQDTANGLYFQGPGGVRAFGSSLPVGNWVHVGVTQDAGTMRLYLDGAQVASFANTPSNPYAQPLFFGHTAGCAGGAVNLDEVRIFSRGLTTPEMTTFGQQPPTPTNVVVTNVNSTRQDITWTAVPGATRYYIYKDGSNAFLTSIPGSNAFFFADHLSPATNYSWSVISEIGDLYSDRSAEVSLTTLPPPNPVSGLTATTVNSTRINLSWTGVPEGVKYFVDMSTSGGPFVRRTTVLAPATSVQIVGLAPNTTYTFRVITQDAGRTNSTPSGTASATTNP